ncbi:MAG: hypothetical protein JWR52_1447 [Marmoricola sp.]|nr:hypothetical protein [Marmoricola sp.]
MRKFFGQVPLGVWCGLTILVLAAWSRDVLGLALGVGLTVVTLITTSRRDKNERR